MPKLSIIVPVYRVEKYLERCIESILSQSFTDFELILIDDGSPDNCGEICDTYAFRDRRIKVIHQNNLGQSKARNKGVKIAQGEYLGFVDSDDWITKDMYEYLVSIIENNNCDIAEIKCAITKKEIQIKDLIIQQEVIGGNNALIKYLFDGMNRRDNGYSVCNKIYKKHLFDGIIFGEISYGEDYLINFKLISRAKKMVSSNLICYYYYQRPESTTHSKLKKRDLDIIINCSKVLELATEKNLNVVKSLADARLGRCYFSLLTKAILYGIDREINIEDIKSLQVNLRKNYFKLMYSPMPINRKFIMTALVINSFIKIIKIRYD